MTTLRQFETDRQGRWAELEDLLDRARRRPERLGPEAVRRLAILYRATAADLVHARQRHPGDPLVDRLEALVRRGQGMVYERRSRRGNLADFLIDRYWALLWLRRRALALTALILVGPGIAAGLWAFFSPQAVSGLVPPEFLWVASAETTDQGLGPAGLAGFSTYVLVNNIRVALTAFVLGITWGLGTGLLIGYNGAIFGVITVLAAQAGNLGLIGEAVLAHGILELSGIVVAGAAGLSLGRAMLRPGRRTRVEALTTEARHSLALAAGTAPWFVVAGLVEGYASRVGLSLGPTAVIGVALGAAFWGLVIWRGSQAGPALGAEVGPDAAGG